MARSPWLASVAIVLVVITFFTGCAGVRPAGDDDSAIARADTGATDAAKTHGGHDGRAALYVVATVFFAIVVIVDVFLLPCTIPAHRPFCCTHEVIFVCFR